MATAKEQADMDALKDDIARLRADVEKLGKTLGATGQGVGDKATQAGTKALSTVEGQIRTRPLPSVLLAAALGLVIGRLLNR